MVAYRVWEKLRGSTKDVRSGLKELLGGFPETNKIFEDFGKYGYPEFEVVMRYFGTSVDKNHLWTINKHLGSFYTDVIPISKEQVDKDVEALLITGIP